jgi:hypothetical protein
VFGLGWFEKIFMVIGATYFGWGISEVMNNKFFRKQQRKYEAPPTIKICPMCQLTLVSNGPQCIETLDDHVMCREPSNRETLKCKNEKCKLHGKMFWSKDGETYSTKECGHKEFDELTALCIGKNNSPFGTLERKLNVEINKSDENYELFKSDKIRIDVVWWYISDYNGNILFRKPKLQIWYKYATMHGDSMTLYIPGIKMFIHCVKHFHSMRKCNADTIKDYAQRASWPKAEWWRVWSYKYMKVIDRMFPVDTSFTPKPQLKPGMKFSSRAGDKSIVGKVVYNNDMLISDKKADMVMSPESGYKREHGDIVQKQPNSWILLARKHLRQK